ncbi:MAG: (d)CMP kinase, partial [Brevibacterium sp.]|nr:(d)CMP kinase [Brevibacterium sp.]
TAKETARRLGYRYLDTGAMYRAVAWLCLNRGVSDPVDVLEQVRGVDLEISTDPDEFFVSVDGLDVSEEIREPEVSENVQTVSAVVDAREELIDMQRTVIAAAPEGIVVEGRDITTVVAPDAQVRILMTARDEVRVARRAKELHGNADAETLAATQSQVTGRDAKDSATTSFLEASEGVYTLDTSDIDFDQVVETVLKLVKDSQ